MHSRDSCCCSGTMGFCGHQWKVQKAEVRAWFGFQMNPASQTSTLQPSCNVFWTQRLAPQSHGQFDPQFFRLRCAPSPVLCCARHRGPSVDAMASKLLEGFLSSSAGDSPRSNPKPAAKPAYVPLGTAKSGVRRPAPCGAGGVMANPTDGVPPARPPPFPEKGCSGRGAILWQTRCKSALKAICPAPLQSHPPPLLDHSQQGVCRTWLAARASLKLEGTPPRGLGPPVEELSPFSSLSLPVRGWTLAGGLNMKQKKNFA